MVLSVFSTVLGKRFLSLGQIEERLRVLGGDLLDFSAFSAVKLG